MEQDGPSTVETSSAIVSTVLNDFCTKHASKPILLPCMKLLKVLISNVSTKKDEKYKTILLNKPKLQQYVVKVEDALDVLALAGFVLLSDGSVDRLYYTPNAPPELAQQLLVGLTQQIDQLEQRQQKQSTTSSTTDSTFLSDAERQRRYVQAKLARQQKAAERKLVQQRWKEDQQERMEAVRRKEALQNKIPTTSNSSNATLAVGVSISHLETDRRKRSVPTNKARSDTNKQQQQELPPVAPQPMVVEKDVATTIAHDVARLEDEQKKEPPTKEPPMIPIPVRDPQADARWKTLIKDISSCEASTGIRDTSVYRNQTHPSDALPVTCLKRLYAELKELQTSLPNDRLASIWVRFDEETPQYVRALLTAPLGTPYAGGLFGFDIFVPNDYPNVPPTVTLLTTGGGRVRFGPNLYANGKVCLSLLGTWPGPKWSPKHSNLYQVLVSIQGLILGSEQPYFLEPGQGGWEGDVRDGQYVQQGQTLSGVVVRSQVGLPPHIQQYNNVLRVGTVRFAILQSLSGTQQHLNVFEEVIRRHFSCNRESILKEVRLWPTDFSNNAAEQAQHPSMSRFRQKASGDLNDLVPKLEKRLNLLVEIAPSKSEDRMSDNEPLEDRKMPAVEAVPSNLVPAKRKPDEMEIETDTTKTTAPSSSSASKAKALRDRMQEAATAGNYVVAGQLQEQVNQVEDLERRIQEAAAEGNFIRAGRLQEQMEHLLNSGDAVSDPTGPYAYDPSAQDEENEDEMGMGSDGLMSSGIPPPGHPGHHSHSHHQWGSGQVLNTGSTLESSSLAPVAAVAPSNDEPTIAGVVIRKAPPPASACRLRFRLPESKTCLEVFDRSDPLSSVYSHLESILTLDPQQSTEAAQQEVNVTSAASLNHDVAPPVRTGGAWAQPQSSTGFTLLLSHPKREFNLEMHGTKTLAELGLAPAATLTVMKTCDRGVAYRGELESRLSEAQGNHMDVDGLTYEGLLELTERVGAAKLAALTPESLDQNSTLLSPSCLDATAEGNDHCPICLGEFDGFETNKILRKLNRCGHTFHSACLATWLGTKSSCPMCKTSIIGPS